MESLVSNAKELYSKLKEKCIEEFDKEDVAGQITALIIFPFIFISIILLFVKFFIPMFIMSLAVAIIYYISYRLQKRKDRISAERKAKREAELAEEYRKIDEATKAWNKKHAEMKAKGHSTDVCGENTEGWV